MSGRVILPLRISPELIIPDFCEHFWSFFFFFHVAVQIHLATEDAQIRHRSVWAQLVTEEGDMKFKTKTNVNGLM